MFVFCNNFGGSYNSFLPVKTASKTKVIKIFAKLKLFEVYLRFFYSYLKLFELKYTKKEHLPTKICQTCQRPFAWRKKWEKVWEDVKYCSDKCRMNSKNKNLDINKNN